MAFYTEDAKNCRALARDIQSGIPQQTSNYFDNHPYLVGWLLGLAERLDAGVKEQPRLIRSDVEYGKEELRF